MLDSDYQCLRHYGGIHTNCLNDVLSTNIQSINAKLNEIEVFTQENCGYLIMLSVLYVFSKAG